jgi:hypothetical protein
MKKYSLAIDGKVYISSNRASEIAGYSKDYVGQLCRSGKLECRRVNRLWWVDEGSIRKHVAETMKSNRTSFRSTANVATLKEVVPSVPNTIVHLAEGGIVTEPTLAIIGEAGPEAVVPLSGVNDLSGDAPSLVSGYTAKTPISRKASLIVVIALIFALGSISLAALFSPASREPATISQTVSDTENSANAISGAYGGLAVVPSQGSTTDAKLAQSIRNSFSDNVTVSPDKSGTAGVITPEFRSVQGHDFLYVLVPVKATTTPVVDDSK